MASLPTDRTAYHRFAIACSAAVLLAYSAVMFDPADVRPLLLEDSLYESLTSLFFAAAAVTFALAYWYQRNLFFALLGLAFLLAAGEEISWGQRIIDFRTPEFFAEHNAQREFNLHNLEWVHRGRGGQGFPLNTDRLFSLFWATYCLAIPAAVLMSARAADVVRRIHLPVVSLWIGIFFPVNYLIAKSFELTLPAERLAQVESYIEIKEAVLAFVCAMMAVDFFRRAQAQRRPAPAIANP